MNVARAHAQAQAIEAGKKLKADIGDSKVHFIVSPYTRTRETMHGILQAFHPSQYDTIVEDARIREQEFGMYQASDSFLVSLCLRLRLLCLCARARARVRVRVCLVRSLRRFSRHRMC